MSKNLLTIFVALAAGLALSACGPGETDNNNDPIVINGDAGVMDDDAGMTGGDAGMDSPDMTVVAECEEPNGVRPPQISEHAGAFVPTSGPEGALIMFGGSLGIPENCGFPERTYETKTWHYDVACDQWTEIESDTVPPGRTRHTMVYDSVGDRVIMFGGLGQGSTPLSDTWAFDVATGQWSQISTGAGPAARLTHTASFDPSGNRMLVFGGNSGSVINLTPLNDVWALDLSDNSWSNVTPAEDGPEPRLWVASVWDPDQNLLVIYAGGDAGAFSNDATYFDDAWAWSEASGAPAWRPLDRGSANAPAGRFWPGLAYDSVNKRYVMFGGHDATSLGNRNDTWFLDPATGEWTEHLGGDTWNKPPNGFCDFPPDFANVMEGTPERRNAHVFVAGPTGAYAMGGKTDCGIVDDLTRLNFETGEWETLTRATAGEVCLRRGGGDTCSGLCL